MATMHDHISPKLQEFISKQHLFFVATAAQDGRVNLSPKGLDSLRILDENRIVWLNLTGSGNETAAHLLEVNRMTIMFCSFEKNPMILRLYGTAETYHRTDAEWKEHADLFDESRGMRQIYVMKVESVQTSCGYAVPFYEFKENREVLTAWTEKRSDEELKDYWQEKNMKNIDNKPTGMKF
ncbi:MAG: hypothetical protein ACI85O_002195 [Saprospiraceae bacterium]|jgi:hypothetical protein